MEKTLSAQIAIQAPDPSRFVVLDTLRGLTVILAMLDHVKVQFVPDFHLFVPVTRLATPCFIILFGAMIEIAYLSKLRSGTQIGTVRQRMAARFVTCWGLAILLTLAAVASGNLGFEAGWKSIIGLDFGRFNEIFLIYAALFLLLIVLLPRLVVSGAVPLLAMASAGWLLQPLWAEIIKEPGYAASFFLGVGEGYGPALLPALTFLGFGLAIGEMLTGRRGPLVPIAVFVVAAVLVAWELSYGPVEAGRRFLAHRWINHPGYYAVGIIAFSGLTCAILLAYRVRFLDRLLRGLAKIGGQTLFIYAVGNLFLNCLPMVVLPRVVGMPVAFLFLAGLISLALVGQSHRNTLGLGLPHLWGRAYGKVRDQIVFHMLNGKGFRRRNGTV